jgi:hypothetical protein
MTVSRHVLVEAAARNNAEWCALVSRSHGVVGTFGREAWTAPTRTPPLYPDAVTLAPGADATALLSSIDTERPGASVKDSFADVNLTSAGFRVLFDADWICRPADAPAARAELAWETVTDARTLRAWEVAWNGGSDCVDLFHSELLKDPNTVFLVGKSGSGRVAAGAVATRSEGVVGISNVFALAAEADAAWQMALQAVTTLFPGLAVVGYERGDDLATAVRHGFERTGPLRVWLHDEAHSV